MIELIGNCSHFSETAIYLERSELSGKKAIIKTATTLSGIENLRREIKGWQWYQSRRFPDGHPKCQIIHERESYIKIQMEFIEGSQGDYYRGLVKNVQIVRAIVRHYCDLWPLEEKVPVHGDLAIGNVIFNADGIHVIDWEHFTLDAGPWGYDIVYFLFATLRFGMRFRRHPNKREICIIAESLKSLDAKYPLTSDIIENPLRFLQDFIVGNPEIWSNQLSKFPVLRFTSKQVSLMDRLISTRLQDIL